ncbi:MAG: hypothetical protein NC083_08745 [Muribaculum sp.]|nr:hypothetical protein [Muribaculum sp.]MCM1577046.1 hypothetical protein [Bacteroides sp.]
METRELINVLKKRTHNQSIVCYKYALFTQLFNKGLTITNIAKITGYYRYTIYYGIRLFSDLLSINDSQALCAKDELGTHTIRVIENVKSSNARYTLTIDNIIY